MIPIFAGMDSLIGLIIFILISAVASWLQRRQQGGENEDMPPPRPRRRTSSPPPPPPPVRTEQPRTLTWEEELKQLLEGQTPQAPPPPPPLPPPVLVERRSQPPPPPLPEEFTETTYSVEHSPVEVSFKPLPGLTEAARAYEQASSLEQKVEAHMRGVTRHPVGTSKVEHAALSREASHALALVRDPSSLRSALLASVILGPPKALADS